LYLTFSWTYFGVAAFLLREKKNGSSKYRFLKFIIVLLET
jgi:hypothetical protein